MPPRHRARHRPPRRKRSDRQPGATRTVRAVHEVQHPRHAGTRRPDARVAGSDSLGAGCHLRSVTNDRDHAVRAVQMAVEMQNRMQTLRQKWLRDGFEQPFEIRIGINTGQASIGNFGSKGRMDYTAIGRQVNLAARLQAYCRPGKILISHSTWVLVQEHVSCTPQGEIQVKGFHGSSKVEMSAVPAQCRDARTPHVEHEGTGSPAGPDADRRAAPDAPARGGAAPWRTTIAASPRRRGSPNRQPTARRSRSCTWRRSLCSPRTSPPCCRTPCPPCRAGKSR